MEWYHKNLLQWDWENLDLISGKVSEICNSTEESEWGVGVGAVSNGSLFSPDSSTFSGSELLDDSSKNYISTSTGSLIILRNSTSDVNLDEANDILKSKIESKNEGMILGEDHRSSPVIVESICTGEPPIGLKLGKRTYFENLSSTNFKNTLPASVKRSRASNMAIQHSRCQVDGCNIDLTGAKDYHRKHRVCASHSKSHRVTVAGHELRFCQQCSRFHDLSEFDQKKRSCRRRLFDHNARRRKPQPKTISFKPSRLPPTFYDERQQMNFFLNPSSNLRQPSSTSSLWDDHSHGFSPSMAKGSWIKSTNSGADGQSHSSAMDFADIIDASRDDFHEFTPFKLAATELLNQGLEASMSAYTVNGAPDLQRALSPLSYNAHDPSITVPRTTVLPPAAAVNSSHERRHDRPSLDGRVSEPHLIRASFETSTV